MRGKWLAKVSRLTPEMFRFRVKDFRDPLGFGVLEKLEAAGGRGWVTLSGPHGSGKTFLLAAIVNESLRADVEAVYTTAADLLADLRRTYDKDQDTSFSTLFEQLLGVPVLCLDEIEKFSATAWAEEQIFRLIDHRYRAWDQGLTVLATNRDTRSGAAIVESTRHPNYWESRIADARFTTINLWGSPDFRPVQRRAS